MTLPIGSWSWSERWLYPDQINDRPSHPSSTLPLPVPVSDLSLTSTTLAQTSTQRPLTGQTSNQQQQHTTAYIPQVPTRARDGPGLNRQVSQYSEHYRHPHDPSLHHLYPASTITQHQNKTAAITGAQVMGDSAGLKTATTARGRLKAPSDFLYHHLDSHYFETDEQKSLVRPEQRSFRLNGRLNPAHCVVPYETETAQHYGPTSTLQAEQQDRTHYMKVHRKDYKEALARQQNVSKEMAENMKLYKQSGLH